MMNIKEGKHYPGLGWFNWPWPLFTERIMKVVTFYPSTKYDLRSNDQQDWNKLFGIAFFPGKHKTSYRFGWRYNIETQMMELGAYSYIDGERDMHQLTSIRIMQSAVCEIARVEGGVKYTVSTHGSLLAHYFIPVTKWQWFGWRLGLFFGGNRPAPNFMRIEIDNV